MFAKYLRVAIVSLILIAFALFVHAEDERLEDAEKYPQETPEKALASIAKSLEAGDYTYFITWLVTPTDTNVFILGNHAKSVSEAVKKSTINKGQMKGLAGEIRNILQMIKAFKKVGDEDLVGRLTGKHKYGVEERGIIKYPIDSVDSNKATEFRQLAKQNDGRWCLDLHPRPPEKLPEK